MPLDKEKIQQLLALRDSPKLAREPEIKQGPVRPMIGNKTRRCVNRGCMTPAYWMVNGMPYCNIHTVYHLNAIIVEQSGEEVTWKAPDPVDTMDLLDIIYNMNEEIRDYGYVSTVTSDRVKETMNSTHYPSLKQQLNRYETYRNGGTNGSN